MSGTWDVTVTATDSSTHTPDVLDRDGGPARIPTVNGLPTIEIPVPLEKDSNGDPKWLDSKFGDGATMSVDYNGTTQPIDVLRDVRIRPGYAVLVGEGGDELTERVTKRYEVQETHLAAQNLIQNNTTYTANVDTPSTTTDTQVEVQTATTTAEFQSRLRKAIPNDSPLRVTSDELTLHQSLAIDSSSTQTFDTLGDVYDVQLTPGYEVPTGEIGVGILIEDPGGSSTQITNALPIDVNVDGKTTRFIEGGYVGPSGGRHWVTDNVLTDNGLSSGTQHDVVFSPVRRSGEGEPVRDAVVVDAVCVYDNRYSYTFATDLVAGPELYPDAVDAVFHDVEVSRAVTGGTVSSSWDDTSNSQAVAISNDRGQSYTSASNTTSLDHDFSDRGATLRLKVTLSRWGDDVNQEPQQGFNAQSMQDFTLDADLEDMPLVVEEEFDGRLDTVLSELADTARGEFVWEFRRSGGTDSVEWTQPAQRVESTDPTTADYEISRSTDEVIQKAVIRGSHQRASGEAFRANHGTAIDLARPTTTTVDAEIVSPESTSVVDPDAGVEFDRGVDYTTDATAGTITTLSGGDMVDGERYEISYTWLPIGVFAKSGASDPTTRVASIPALRTNRGCALAARQLVEAGDTPRFEAQIIIPTNDADWSTVDELDPTTMPSAGETFLINQVSAAPGRTVMRLASRRELADVLSGIGERVEAISRSV